MTSRLATFSLLLSLAACGSDPAPTDGGFDGGPDAATDSAISADAGTDAAIDDGTDDGTDSGTDAGPEVDPVRAANLCAAFDAYIEETGLPGGNLGVRFLNGATHVCSSGFANVAASQAIAPDDGFSIGSVSKTFTAAMMLLLQQDGVLSLEDPLSDWVSGFDDSDPTIAQLLNHTSGLGEYLFDDALRAEETRAHTEDELLAVARTKPIDRAPGGRFAYSNTNFLLLGFIASAAIGAHWSEYMRQRILVPLGLNATFIDGYEAVGGRRVSGYSFVDDALVDVTGSFHPSLAGAAGCMVSTADDLLRWSNALYGGELLSAESIEQMNNTYRVPHAHDDGIYEGSFVGLANFIGTDDGEYGEVYGHSGGTPGFSSNMRRFERDGRAQIVLLNGNTVTSSEFNHLTGLIWEALLL